jgi:cold shock CspA family protein
MIETGRMMFFKPDQGWGFIHRRSGGGSPLFVHISQILAADDGLQYEPVKDCLVEFEVGSDDRSDRVHAINVGITQWPVWMYAEQVPADPVAEHFLTVEELSMEFPEPSGSPLFSPENRSRSLLELIRDKK